ncbi:YceI family protein [Dyadobacter sp. 3J3]|uniref:YceI family protein n=1 Tax=Dyadobacter sp. 3J3 TaxID=2606600 RepID=UPI001356F993|nr:YceI family protein [Dyadobacter sp. 3J3]
MNKELSVIYLILTIIPLFFGCGGGVKEENKNIETESSTSLGHVSNEKYSIDTKESVVTWKGSSLIGSNSHTGYVYISQGELMIENGKLKGGSVEIDMNTIEDKNHGRDNKLVNHLKDPDFFDIKKFPFSKITITKIAYINADNHKVTGNLSIKAITHSVTFPVRMEVKNGVAQANGWLVIDRAKWDVRYKSSKFYDILANQVISDSIEFQVKIIAKK